MIQKYLIWEDRHQVSFILWWNMRLVQEKFGNLILFRVGIGPKKLPHTSFSHVTSATVGISPRNVLALVLPHCCKISRPYLAPVPNYWTWTKSTPQKNWFSSSNLYKTEVMITSLTESLELRNFGHMTLSTI